MDKNIDTIILAAGKGSRMRSTLPKVLHKVGGKPMLQHVVDQASLLESENSKTHVIVGHGADHVQSVLSGQALFFVVQQEQLGTGHAVAQALDNIYDDGVSLILYGDVPLTPTNLMQELVTIAKSGNLGLLTVTLDNPQGYGRIVRDINNKVTAIVEQKDADKDQLSIREVNTGIMAVANHDLKKWIRNLDNNNAQQEYYLTDIIEMACKDNVAIVTCSPDFEQQVQGVNDKVQLAQLERFYQSQKAEEMMVAGATLADPSRIDVRGNVKLLGEVEIDINVIFEGSIEIGEGVKIGANSIISNSVIGSGTVIKPNSIIEDSDIANDCEIGPFARIRPGTELANNTKIGNFVETKKSKIGAGSKVNHLTYVGDALIGENVNIGAGTITCNYDGVNKYQTIIQNDAFIGSNSALVAPVTIGEGATVGAGSTISKPVPEGQLAITRSKQLHLSQWERSKKNSK